MWNVHLPLAAVAKGIGDVAATHNAKCEECESGRVFLYASLASSLWSEMPRFVDEREFSMTSTRCPLVKVILIDYARVYPKNISSAILS
jgi:hypothetical protein